VVPGEHILDLPIIIGFVNAQMICAHFNERLQQLGLIILGHGSDALDKKWGLSRRGLPAHLLLPLVYGVQGINWV